MCYKTKIMHATRTHVFTEWFSMHRHDLQKCNFRKFCFSFGIASNLEICDLFRNSPPICRCRLYEMCIQHKDWVSRLATNDKYILRVCIFCVLIRVTHETMCPISYMWVSRWNAIQKRVVAASVIAKNMNLSLSVCVGKMSIQTMFTAIGGCLCASVSGLAQCDWTLFNLCKAWMHVTRNHESTYLASVILRSVFNFPYKENESQRKSESSQT